MKLSIIYWSGTGNTETMASLIEAGAATAGLEVSRKPVGEAAQSDISGADVVALGCPSMGSEVLEESEFEPFMASIEGELSGKRVGLFGSYGWGDGQWMRDWQQRVESLGAKLISDGLIVNETPSGEDEERCKAFGAALAVKG